MGNLSSIFEFNRTNRSLNQSNQKSIGSRTIHPIKAGKNQLCFNKEKDFKVARKKRLTKVSHFSSNDFFSMLKNVRSLEITSLHLKLMIPDRISLKNLLATLKNFNALTTLTLELSSYVIRNGGAVAEIHKELRQLRFLSTLNLAVLNMKNEEPML